MADAWDEEKMDSLLLLMLTGKARGFGPDGDFFRDETGHVWRKGSTPPRPYICLGIQLVRPSLYEKTAEKVFSNNLIWNGAEASKRLYGIVHDGSCFHTGTPQDLAEANRMWPDEEKEKK
jgi:MurNAc alpha-1-phosphate uridylyltransferase